MTDTLSPPLRILCAGSLQRAMTEFAAGLPVELAFGPAGLLRERIEAGEACDLFLSANMAHPAALAQGRRVACFARNGIVAASRPEIGLREDNFLQCLLDPAVRIGSSTPGADPGGDYAAAVFAKAGPAAEAVLRAKTHTLVGGREPPPPTPAGTHPIRHFLASGVVDVFMCYGTTAKGLAADFAIVAPPPDLRVIADYGSVVLAANPTRASAAAAFETSLTQPAGQACLARYGFLTI
jgi:molybdate transport system substrate-binding protein